MCVRGGCARKIPAPCTHSTFLLKIRTRSLIFHIPPRTRPCVFCAVSATSARVGATRGERRFPPPVCALCALLSYIINSVHPTPPTQLAENRGRNVPGHTWCMAYLRGPPLYLCYHTKPSNNPGHKRLIYCRRYFYSFVSNVWIRTYTVEFFLCFMKTLNLFVV